MCVAFVLKYSGKGQIEHAHQKVSVNKPHDYSGYFAETSSLVEHVCFEMSYLSLHNHLCIALCNRLLFLGQMLHVSLRRSW